MEQEGQYFKQIKELVQREESQNFSSLVAYNSQLNQKLIAFCQELDKLLSKRELNYYKKFNQRKPATSQKSSSDVTEREIQNNSKQFLTQEKELKRLRSRLDSVSQPEFFFSLEKQLDETKSHLKTLQNEIKQTKLLSKRTGSQLQSGNIRTQIKEKMLAESKDIHLITQRNNEIKAKIKQYSQNIIDCERKNEEYDHLLMEQQENIHDLKNEEEKQKKYRVIQDLSRKLRFEEMLLEKTKHNQMEHKMVFENRGLTERIGKSEYMAVQKQEEFVQSESKISQLLQNIHVKKEHKIKIDFRIRNPQKYMDNRSERHQQLTDSFSQDKKSARH